MITRTEYTIEVSKDPDFRDSYTLVPIAGGHYSVARERLGDLVGGSNGEQFYRLVKREIKLTEWEPV